MENEHQGNACSGKDDTNAIHLAGDSRIGFENARAQFVGDFFN